MPRRCTLFSTSTGDEAEGQGSVFGSVVADRKRERVVALHGACRATLAHVAWRDDTSMGRLDDTCMTPRSAELDGGENKTFSLGGALRNVLKGRQPGLGEPQWERHLRVSRVGHTNI